MASSCKAEQGWRDRLDYPRIMQGVCEVIFLGVPLTVVSCRWMGLLADSKIAGCACARNVGNVLPRHRLQRKPLVSDPGMHHGTCVTHVPWCMPGSPTRGDRENVPGIPGACASRYLCIWQEAHTRLFTRPSETNAANKIDISRVRYHCWRARVTIAKCLCVLYNQLWRNHRYVSRASGARCRCVEIIYVIVIYDARL